MPALVTELEQLLQEEGEPALSAQVCGLHIVERCRCGDDFCATFYTCVEVLYRDEIQNVLHKILP
jgi:hypothetical protein